MKMPAPQLNLVVVSAGVSETSSTRRLADRIAGAVVAAARSRRSEVAVTVIELPRLATEITAALTHRIRGPRLAEAIEAVAAALAA